MTPIIPQDYACGPVWSAKRFCRPTGVVTFLFTDIVNSTYLWDNAPQAMARAFQQHEQLLRTACANFGGYVYKMVGDAFQVAFAHPTQALQAALAVQRQSAGLNWGVIGPLRVRMALHIGCTDERPDDYIGPILNRLGRLVSAASGGQILLSQEVSLQLRPYLPATITLGDLGPYRVKDLRGAERIFQVIVADLPRAFPPLNPELAQPIAVPAPALPLLSREAA
jgi:class 3 adenylate cyclase